MPLLALGHCRRTNDLLQLGRAKPRDPAVFAGVFGLLFGVTGFLLKDNSTATRYERGREHFLQV
jgi:hypothetical protein